MPSWLDPTIKFLNENNGIITAIATVVLVGITWWYVRITKQILKATNIPIVRLFLHAGEYDITLCVQNIGIGFAREIKFTGDLSFKPIRRIIQRKDKEQRVEEDPPLKELEPFKSGIEYLGPGHKIETFLFRRGDLNKLPNHTFDIVVTYKDLAGVKETKTFPFEIGNWDNTDQFGSPHTDETANALQKISRILDSMRSDNAGRDSWNRTASAFQDAPKMEALERIADALDRISSDE